jgi:ABC-2 type transport system ATP-binding protein
MTTGAFLEFIARIRGFSGAEATRRIAIAVERAGLSEVLRQPIEILSKGFKRRVGLAQALLHDPEVLILDEPTDGLDPNQRREVRKLIAELAPAKAIVISTHLLDDVEAVCTRAVIIARGRLLADGAPSELASRSRFHNAVRLGLAREHEAAIRAHLSRLPAIAEVASVEDADGPALMAFSRNGAPILAEIVDSVRDQRWSLRSVSVERGRLDDVFREITAAAGPSPAPKNAATLH